jgi:hypothetical protein
MLESARLLAVLTLAVLPLSAPAFGWRQPRTVYCYYPATVVVVAPVAYGESMPLWTAPPVAAPRPLAQPVPAPPSRTPLGPQRTQEPPLNAPTIRESRKELSDGAPYYNAYALASTDAPRPAGDRCRVTFWNLTDHAITLKVGDQLQRIVRNEQSRPLELDRQFIWRVDDREPQTERVPAGETGLVIVIRR